MMGLEDPSNTEMSGISTAITLRHGGINLNFAPVADLNLNPENPSIAKKNRAFGSDPFRVAKHVQAFYLGQKYLRVLTTLKHFPGIGSAGLDTHCGFVDISETWTEQELIPYRELIQAGYQDLIMVGHVFNRHLDNQFPATLSQKIISNLLRDKLKFKGIVVTDDLQMAAIRNFYSLEDSVQLAILAGSDLLLFANTEVYDEQIAPRVIDIVKKMIKTGKIPVERIEESFNRIQELKKRLF